MRIALACCTTIALFGASASAQPIDKGRLRSLPPLPVQTLNTSIMFNEAYGFYLGWTKPDEMVEIVTLRKGLRGDTTDASIHRQIGKLYQSLQLPGPRGRASARPPSSTSSRSRQTPATAGSAPSTPTPGPKAPTANAAPTPSPSSARRCRSPPTTGAAGCSWPATYNAPSRIDSSTRSRSSRTIPRRGRPISIKPPCGDAAVPGAGGDGGAVRAAGFRRPRLHPIADGADPRHPAHPPGRGPRRSTPSPRLSRPECVDDLKSGRPHQEGRSLHRRGRLRRAPCPCGCARKSSDANAQDAWKNLPEPTRQSLLQARGLARRTAPERQPHEASEACETMGMLEVSVWGDNAKAEADFREAITKDPTRETAWHLLLMTVSGGRRSNSSLSRSATSGSR